MPESTIETSPASQYAVLVTFTWGDSGTPHVKRYTQWDEPITILGETWESEPTLSVQLPEQSGNIEEKAANIEISARLEPLLTMSKGFKHARVRVKVEQVDPNDLTTQRALFFGWVVKVSQNPGGRAALLRGIVNGVKAQLMQIRMGIPATTECQWQFAGFGCGVDRSSSTYSGVVTALGDPADNSVTLSLPGVGTPAVDLRNTRFRRGQIIVDGLAIPIRMSREDFRFDLFSLPPPSWLGKSCVVLPGCDKRLTTCINEWDNEIQYLGVGIAIPSRNPLFEE